nr:hypothetical protein [Candidatus Anoxychlamydiales bacterium]
FLQIPKAFDRFTNIENIRSIKLLNSIMEKEGTLKERDKLKGAFRSVNVYSILRKEYILKKAYR